MLVLCVGKAGMEICLRVEKRTSQDGLIVRIYMVILNIFLISECLIDD